MDFFYLGEKEKNHYQKLVEDITGAPKSKKHLMTHIMAPIDRRFTQWRSFDNRRARRLNYEQHICVFSGAEEFRLVSPIYKKNLYVNVFEQYHPEETPVDFFDPRPRKYPLTRYINWLNTTLEAGDCMYVPAYYYVQSQTVGKGIRDETIMMAEQYESHSKYIDLIMAGLDQNGLEEQDTEDKDRFDQAIKDTAVWMGLV